MRRTVVTSGKGAALGALLLLGSACTSEVDAGGGLNDPTRGGDGGMSMGCACTGAQVCSKAGAGCIDPGTCGGDADCDAGYMCVTGMDGRRTCVIGGKCGGQEVTAEAVPPNMLVVLDRSCSMRGMVDGKMKWELAVAALNTLTKNFSGKIRFGLTLFPDREGDSCRQGAIPIPTGPGKEAQIQGLLTKSLSQNDPNYPDGPCVTNIDTAMEQASKDPALTDPARQSFTLLVTDGIQAGCSAAGGDRGTESIIADLLTKKVRTYVVGFNVAADTTQLNTFAMKGGTGMFYNAKDGPALDRALASIASETLGCDFNLKASPPNAQQIYVFFENMTRVPRSRTNGWDYDEARNRVTFFGAYCQQLREGKVKDVDIVFGCDAPTPG